MPYQQHNRCHVSAIYAAHHFCDRADIVKLQILSFCMTQLVSFLVALD